MNTTIVAIAAAAVLLAAGVGAVVLLSGGESNDKDTITVTMSWEKDLVEDIVGDDYNVVSMMGSNVSPHEDYTTPSNVADLYSSKMYFKIGSGVEWETLFMDAVSKDIPSSVTVVDIASSITYTALPNTHHHHHDGEENGEEEEEEAYDPHIWTSPAILKSIAALVCEKVSALNPGSAEKYETNLTAFNDKVAAVDTLAGEVAALAGTEHTHVMVWHPAWQYLLAQYCNSFGCELCMESVEADGEVTPAEAAQIVKDEGCSAIYVSTTDEGYEGRAALEEAGITVHVVNPTATDMLESVTEFLNYLKADLQA